MRVGNADIFQRIERHHQHGIEPTFQHCQRVIQELVLGHEIDFIQRGKLLLFNHKGNGLFHLLANANAHLVPEMAGNLVHLFQLKQQGFVKL